MSREPRYDLAQAAEAAARLKAELGPLLDPDDDRLWADTLEGETDLVELILVIDEAALKDESDIGYIKMRQAQLDARKTRLETRVKKAREAIVQAMETAELSRIDRPDKTISLAKGLERVEVDDPDALPPDCWRHIMPKLDLEGIKRRLKAGENIPGARLVRGDARLMTRRT